MLIKEALHANAVEQTFAINVTLCQGHFIKCSFHNLNNSRHVEMKYLSLGPVAVQFVSMT